MLKKSTKKQDNAETSKKEKIAYLNLGGGLYIFESAKTLGEFAEEHKESLILVQFAQKLVTSSYGAIINGCYGLFHEKETKETS